MNVVDWVLLGALAVFALIGWRRGFVAGLFSFVGFLGAGLLVALVLPKFIDDTSWSALTRGLVIGAAILIASFAGQFAMSIIGDRISDSLSWKPAQVLDRIGGAVLNVFVLAIVTWVLASFAGYLPTSAITDQINASKMVTSIESFVPPQTQTVFKGLQGVLKSTDVPTLFAGLDSFTGPEVAEPTASALTPEVYDASQSVVKITGATGACNSEVSGSGFVIAPHRVATNAHVVAGVRKPLVQIQRENAPIRSTVIYFDPDMDIAILHVPSMFLPTLDLSVADAPSGAPAAAAGYPHSGPFKLEPVRVRTLVSARGDDIYGITGLMRRIYLVRGSIQKGFSGGPMLSPEGSVMGMVFGADQTQQRTGYVIAASELQKALELVGDSKTAVGTGSCFIRD